ncbi:hypothetical protein [Chryseobacterium sp. EO14]|uniref:hypothetical protein n=1 Tax=Chryseobacterium sp. EO14 TaxID=2950551 RepID=UPI00210D59BF|nr:hypothetical protein [Chryseobacterium sp. EO14]MCQ4139236.1 hypothetical protein [Chryseobacterium sp. EO14]
MSCDTCTLNLCEIVLDCDNTGIIDLGMDVPTPGEYILKLKYLSSVLEYSKTFISGDPFLFELTRLNENYCYSFSIEKGGQRIFVNNGGKPVSNFTFCTKKAWKIS